ncbi:thiamine pyrophosphate-binding protein [Brevibacillus invocatus]|uniref:Thiamine pyrophosphate-binding protein n=1 Tax=Brevibacillus invocatus TaxID=173959 RepID=A0A3M8CMU5_9BACL|nr:thiamine pyrophosphate-binding protein [Brevibacillus invocatus]RNB76627.1 thiamine pyrophosphate-binding protein [Brevibacillus invocatus]
MDAVAQMEAKTGKTRQNSTSARNVAQHLVQQLTLWGVERIYGVIGDGNLFLLDELGKQNRITYIACRHETNAAIMASADAKLTGKLAVCTCTSGPGLASIMNGLADAWADRVPLLLISGHVESTAIGLGGVQDINQQLLIQPLAEFSSLVADSHVFPKLLNKAGKTALHKGGVAHLSVPKEIWQLPVTGSFFPLPIKTTPATPSPEQLIKAAQLIDKAKRPILLAGRGIESAQSYALQFAEKIQAPLMVTMPAKSFVPNDHPLFIGGLGHAGTEISRELLAKADLCIVLGATWWPSDYVPKTVQTVQIDAAVENIGESHPVAAPVVGDLLTVISQLTSHVRQKKNEQYVAEISKKKLAWNNRIEEESKLVSPTDSISPAYAFSVLQKCIDDDAVITLDVGDHTVWFERIFQLKRQKLIISGTWRTLGFGLPAGIACQLAMPDRQVVSVAGDGGVAYSIMELITAVTHKLPLTLFIMNNQSYAMEKNRMIVEGLDTLGSQIPNPDYAALAKACRVESIRVSKSEELEPSIRQALSSRTTSVVEIMCTAPVLPHTKILKGMDAGNH